MNKEEFIKELDKNLRYLSKKDKIEALEKYNNYEEYNLDPIDEANKIYNAKGKKIIMTKEIKFFKAIEIIINNIKLKRKEIIKNLIFFFLYLLFLIIIIKIPFIYIRDMVNNLFNALFTTELSYTIWNVFIEILYAITTILIFIRIIKKKALELEKNV